MIDWLGPVQEVRLARWVRRAQRGDRDAFRELYRALHPLAFRYVSRRIARREDAEDLVAQLFWRLLDGLERIDPRKGSVRAYVLSAARRAVIDHIRSGATRGASEVEPLLPDPSPGALERLIDAERASAVLAALASLAPEKRELLLLRYDEGLRFSEIAQVLGLAEPAVRQRASRALRELRDRLQGDNGSPSEEVAS
jgi:RNA polymerase sigma-70 factor (ECF subfamily)